MLLAEKKIKILNFSKIIAPILVLFLESIKNKTYSKIILLSGNSLGKNANKVTNTERKDFYNAFLTNYIFLILII